jgi:hypothetical protein
MTANPFTVKADDILSISAARLSGMIRLAGGEVSAPLDMAYVSGELTQWKILYYSCLHGFYRFFGMILPK